MNFLLNIVIANQAYGRQMIFFYEIESFKSEHVVETKYSIGKSFF